MNTCHYIFVKIHRRCNNKSKPNVNYGFGMITMCPYGLFNSNKCIALVGNADNGGGCGYVEAVCI